MRTRIWVSGKWLWGCCAWKLWLNLPSSVSAFIPCSDEIDHVMRNMTDDDLGISIFDRIGDYSRYCIAIAIAVAEGSCANTRASLISSHNVRPLLLSLMTESQEEIAHAERLWPTHNRHHRLVRLVISLLNLLYCILTIQRGEWQTPRIITASFSLLLPLSLLLQAKASFDEMFEGLYPRMSAIVAWWSTDASFLSHLFSLKYYFIQQELQFCIGGMPLCV